MISPNTSFTMDTPYTYLYVIHLTFCGRIFNHTILEKVYYGKGKPKQNTFPSFLELCLNSMSFTPFIPKISPRTIHIIYVQECASLLPNEISNNIIFLFQECDTHNRKHLVGRCDFPGSPKLHTIDLEFLNQNALHRLTMTELSKK